MKALYVVIVLLFGMVTSNNISQETETVTVKAVLDYHDEGSFYFVDPEDDLETYFFLKAEEKALKAYDITDEKYEGKVFNVTYKAEMRKDDLDEEYEVWIIVKLALVE